MYLGNKGEFFCTWKNFAFFRLCCCAVVRDMWSFFVTIVPTLILRFFLSDCTSLNKANPVPSVIHTCVPLLLATTYRQVNHVKNAPPSSLPLNSQVRSLAMNSQSTMAKNASPSQVTDCLESHLRDSSFISAAASADADALIIAPEDVSADVLTSPVSAQFCIIFNFMV